MIALQIARHLSERAVHAPHLVEVFKPVIARLGQLPPALCADTLAALIVGGLRRVPLHHAAIEGCGDHHGQVRVPRQVAHNLPVVAQLPDYLPAHDICSSIYNLKTCRSPHHGKHQLTSQRCHSEDMSYFVQQRAHLRLLGF